MTVLNKVCFAIDTNSDVHTTAKFLRHMDTAKAMGTLRGSLILCIGSWNGELEPSYLMDERDYRKLVEPLGFTKGQSSILHIPGDTRQPCTLEYSNPEVPDDTLRPLMEVQHPVKATSWTYVIETGKYFTAN